MTRIDRRKDPADPVLSASASLKRATAAVHARVHELSFFRPLLSGEIDQPSYTTILTRLYGVHAPLEKQLLAAAEILGCKETMRERRRVPDLERDLIEVGLSKAAIRRLSQAQWPSIESLGQFYGVLYVREGSTLGGQVMARALDHLLPDERGRRFLMSYQRNPALWRRLVSILDSQPRPELEEAMIEGALQAFVLLEQWLAGDEVTQ